MNRANIDLETTGLRPDSPILEIAIAITDDDENVIDTFTGITNFIAYTGDDAYVNNMHSQNGLWYLEGMGSSVASLEEDCMCFLAEHDCIGGPLGGSSPQSDAIWLEAQMPRLRKCFNHRVHDATTLKVAMRAVGIEIVEGDDGAKHRALEDILYSCAIIKQHHELMKSIAPKTL